MRLSGLLVLGMTFAAGACGSARDGGSGAETRPQWRVVYQDADYEVSLDTANVAIDSGGGYLVWYQTRHAEPRLESGKPWNRELIRSLLRCQPLSFKTVRITVHLDDGPVVAEQGGELADVRAMPWKPARSPSVDQAAMREACAVIARRRVDGG